MIFEVGNLIITGLGLIWLVFAHFDAKKNGRTFTFVKDKKTIQSKRTFRIADHYFFKKSTHEILL